ncbi:MAG: trigger factor [Candidatus Saccharibacteria bacterium]
MKIEKKEVNPHQLEFNVRVSRAEALPYMQKAAGRLSATREFKGFRPGKAPYEMVKREFGEDKILAEALDDIVNGTLAEVLKQEPVNPYGKIDLDFLPVADADEAAAYKAVINLIPKIVLGDWQKNKVKRQQVSVDDKELEKAIRELTTMVSPEEPKAPEAAAEKNDKVIADLEVLVDGKLIEGGKAENFAVVIGEGRMIPGFEDKLLGIKPGEKREFTLPFPDNYHAEHLSGKPADFKVKALQILAKKETPLDDEMAKKLGAENLPDLKNKLRDNIARGKQEEEDDRLGNAVIKQLVDSATFGELPPVMIDDTVDEMVHEFGHNLQHRGLSLESFLKTSGKDKDQIRKEFEPKAVDRIKASLALMQLAEDENVTIEASEIDDEIKRQEQAYSNNPHALDDIREPDYRRYLANSMLNRKVVDYLKEKLVE